MIRPQTLRKIDALHEEIEVLLKKEKLYYDKQNPNEGSLFRSVAHAKIDVARYCPMHRQLMSYATATTRSVDEY